MALAPFSSSKSSPSVPFEIEIRDSLYIDGCTLQRVALKKGSPGENPCVWEHAASVIHGA